MDKSPVHIPINGIIDLHTFSPKDASDVINEYINVCFHKGILEVKIIHGKGKGILRRRVESALNKHPFVLSFRQDSGPSGWGATIALLKNPNRSKDEEKI